MSAEVDASELVAKLVRRNVLGLSRLRPFGLVLAGTRDRGRQQCVEDVDVSVGGKGAGGTLYCTW